MPDYSSLLGFSCHCSTVVDLLYYRASEQPNQQAFTFLQDGEIQSAVWTYQELDRRSRAIAAHLQAKQLVGERALLFYPPGLDYLAAFFGCLYAGVVAVPAYPPRNHRNTPRILALIQDAQAAIALTTTFLCPKLESLLTSSMGQIQQQWLTTDDIRFEDAIDWRPPAINPNTLAFLQYTSGSTGSPKGVMLSHGNLLHNAAVTCQLMGHSPVSMFVSWLPIYHDMGLIGGILQPLYGGFPCVLMAPASFLQRPFRWLKAISDYGGTTSGGPNFAYDLCVQKITDEQRETLDLSRWAVAFNGAEPVRTETLDRFADAFAVCGFQKSAFYPCYGMAEATLMVSGARHIDPPRFITVDKPLLERGQCLAISDEGSKEEIFSNSANLESILFDRNSECRQTQTLVSCGQCVAQQQIAIVHPETLQRCSPHEIGEIWVSGPSVGHGYWNRSEETEQTFYASLEDAPGVSFLRTGDLGIIQDGELLIVGRVKDLIIIRGRNFYPQDLELAAERSHPALRSNSNAAFSVEINSEEKLVLVQELEFRQNPEVEDVAKAIRQAISTEYEVQVYAVILLKPGTIPKTSSGKIQRRACHAAFLAGELLQYGSSVLDTAADSVTESNPIHLSRTDLLALSSQERLSILTAYLQALAARALHLSVDRIDPQQPPTSFGLDSLTVFELRSRIEQDLSISLTIPDLFDAISLTQLASQILNQIMGSGINVKQNGCASPLAIVPGEVVSETAIYATEITYPLSFSQQRLWVVHQLETDGSAYHIAVSLRLTGSLNSDALAQACRNLMQRHAILRAAIQVVERQPVQVIQPTCEVQLAVVDCRHQPDTEIEFLLTQEAQKPFDLSQAPLWRVQMCQRSDTEHILLITLHHLIADGWSVGIWLREWFVLYTAIVMGKAASLSPLPIQYSDFVCWQRQWLQGEVLELQLQYWQQQLAGQLPVLHLPTDYPRPVLQTVRGARQTWVIPKELTAAIRTLSQQAGATLFMTLLAAFKTLLYRYTGQGDLLVGSPIANRHWAGVDRLIGCFVNTLVLRTDVSDNPRFGELLQRIRQVALAAYAHQDVPFEKLVEILQPERDLSRTPLFQVMFAFQNVPMPSLELPDLVVQLQEIDTQTAKFDLTLFVNEQESELTTTIEYNTDLFQSDTITRMLKHFQQILRGIIVNPQQRLSDLPLLTLFEQQQLLVDWNQTRTSPPAYDSIHQWFETQVEQTPDAIAVTAFKQNSDLSSTQSLTYRKLSQRSNQLAHHLQRLGVKPEVRVGICLDRSIDLMVALLAVLKAGGAYVPLDPTYPPERLAFMLEDADTPVILTDSRIVHTFAHPALRNAASKRVAICLDTAWDTISQESGTNLTHNITADHLAYVIYTSGSTGQPKGTMICHRGLINYLAWGMQAYDVAAGQGAPVHSSISFDMTITALFSPLLAGRRVNLVPDGFGVEALADTLRSHSGFSLVKVTPAQLDLLNPHISALDLSNRTRVLILGGENLSVQQMQQWQAAIARGTTFVNEYGPTETVVGCCVYTIPESLPASSRIPIGRPIANTQLYILDCHLNLVPIGVIGELYIGGAGVARGYLDRPDLTAERFIPHPYSDEPGMRLYRTGDLARYLADGTIECLGRIDYQVKLRGYRIELAEIEAVLNQQPTVQESVVVVHEDSSGNQRLVAYVVPDPADSAPSISALQQVLREKLPEYMVPAMFISLPAIPLTVNSKVDRRALPKPEGLRPELAVPFILPQDGLEQAIAQIWQTTLQVEQVGVDDNFFDLGGHSLLLAQVYYRLKDYICLHRQQVSQHEVSMIDLFRYPTIRVLVQYLTHKPVLTVEMPTEMQSVRNRVKRQKAAFAPLARRNANTNE
jgi:amino acid adenylation domain-containing protein